MTKSEFIRAVQEAAEAQEIKLSQKDTGAFIDALVETIKKSVADQGKLSVAGFGTFTVKDRKARQGRNPQTGEKIQIGPSRSVGFKPASAFKGDLNP